MTFQEALEEIKAESTENRALIEECERIAVLINEAEKQKQLVSPCAMTTV